MNKLESSDIFEVNPNDKTVDPPPEHDPPDTRLINTAKSKGKPISIGEICCEIPKSSTCHVNLAQNQYHASFCDSLTFNNQSLIERGANGGVTGEYVRVILLTNRTADVKGIANHHVKNIGIGTDGGVVNTRPVITNMHQYALLGKDASINSLSQLEWYKNELNDKSVQSLAVFIGLLPCMATSLLLSLKTA
jgi:hypothetical protein